jgi:hypothetical protein
VVFNYALGQLFSLLSDRQQVHNEVGDSLSVAQSRKRNIGSSLKDDNLKNTAPECSQWHAPYKNLPENKKTFGVTSQYR